MKNRIFISALLAFAAVALFNPAFLVPAACMLCAVSVVLANQTPELRVTLSVNELLNQVMDAFKTEFPALTSMAKDVSTETAVKGTTITAHVSTLPGINDYDDSTGWNNGAANASDLIADLPVTLDNFKIVNVKVPFITQLGSKVSLAPEAIRNSGYALAKFVVDSMLGLATSANFSRSVDVAPGNVDLGKLETLRGVCNGQKMSSKERYGIVSTPFAESIAADPKTGSSLFYDQVEGGDSSIRRWKDLCGFKEVIEYPEMPDNGENLNAFFFDPRAFLFAQRSIRFNNAAKELGIDPEIMKTWSVKDATTGLILDAVGWQQPGTGDVYVAICLLFGLAAGCQGGSPGTLTDLAGLRSNG